MKTDYKKQRLLNLLSKTARSKKPSSEKCDITAGVSVALAIKWNDFSLLDKINYGTRISENKEEKLKYAYFFALTAPESMSETIPYWNEIITLAIDRLKKLNLISDVAATEEQIREEVTVIAEMLNSTRDNILDEIRKLSVRLFSYMYLVATKAEPLEEFKQKTNSTHELLREAFHMAIEFGLSDDEIKAAGAHPADEDIKAFIENELGQKLVFSAEAKQSDATE